MIPKNAMHLQQGRHAPILNNFYPSIQPNLLYIKLIDKYTK